MGAHDANISRDMFSEDKAYRRAIAQQGVPVVDADLNDNYMEMITYMRRIVQNSLGDGYVHNAFKIEESDAQGHRSDVEVNNFVVTGSVTPGADITDGGEAGAFFIEGLRCVLFGDVEYGASWPFTSPAGINAESQKSIFPRVVSVEWNAGLGKTIIHDTAQDYVVDELTGRTLTMLSNESGVSALTVDNNTATSITLAAVHGDLTSKIAQYDRYRIDLSTPSGSDRIDAVYLNSYVDQINAQEDPNLYQPLETSVECFIRERVVQEIIVRENVGTVGELTNYTDADGNDHYVQKLAEIDRDDGDDTIVTAMINTNFTYEFVISNFSSAFNIRGSATYANNSTTGPGETNIPVGTGGWPEAPTTFPPNAVYISQNEDDDGTPNPSGFYGIDGLGDWEFLYAVEIEDASLIPYKNKSAGADTWITSPSEMDSVVSELSAAIDLSQKYTMRPGDGYTELLAIHAAIVSGGIPAKITFMPGVYSIAVQAGVSNFDFGSLDVTIEGYGKGNTIINLTGAAQNTVWMITTGAGAFKLSGFYLDYGTSVTGSIFRMTGADGCVDDVKIEGDPAGLSGLAIQQGSKGYIANSTIRGDIEQGSFSNVQTSYLIECDLVQGDDSHFNDNYCETAASTITQGSNCTIANSRINFFHITQSLRGVITGCKLYSSWDASVGNAPVEQGASGKYSDNYFTGTFQHVTNLSSAYYGTDGCNVANNEFIISHDFAASASSRNCAIIYMDVSFAAYPAQCKVSNNYILFYVGASGDFSGINNIIRPVRSGNSPYVDVVDLRVSLYKVGGGEFTSALNTMDVTNINKLEGCVMEKIQGLVTSFDTRLQGVHGFSACWADEGLSGSSEGVFSNNYIEGNLVTAGEYVATGNHVGSMVGSGQNPVITGNYIEGALNVGNGAVGNQAVISGNRVIGDIESSPNSSGACVVVGNKVLPGSIQTGDFTLSVIANNG